MTPYDFGPEDYEGDPELYEDREEEDRGIPEDVLAMQPASPPAASDWQASEIIRRYTQTPDREGKHWAWIEKPGDEIPHVKALVEAHRGVYNYDLKFWPVYAYIRIEDSGVWAGAIRGGSGRYWLDFYTSEGPGKPWVHQKKVRALQK
jgi:hypothetical protein